MQNWLHRYSRLASISDFDFPAVIPSLLGEKKRRHREISRLRRPQSEIQAAKRSPFHFIETLAKHRDFLVCGVQVCTEQEENTWGEKRKKQALRGRP